MYKHCAFVFVVAYNIITYLMYLYGPIEYGYENIGLMSLFLILYLLSFSLGYVFSDGLLYKKSIVKSIDEVTIKRFFFFCSIGSIINSSYFFLKYKLDGMSLFDSFTMIITQPHILYYQSIENGDASSILTQLSTLLSPIFYCTIPLGVILWKRLGFFYRALFCFSLIIYIFSFLIKGTNFGIFLAVISMVVVMYGKDISWKVIFKAVFVGILPVIIFFTSVYLRVGVKEVGPDLLGLKINVEHIVFSLPNILSIPLTIGSSYLTQGYNGFDLALDLNWNVNLGFSRFLIEKINALTGYNIWPDTYQFRLDSVWDKDVQWHTAYVWIANVFGFWGCCVFMFFFGITFNSIMKGSFIAGDLINKMLVPLVLLWGIFLPSNNVVFSMPYTCVAFIGLWSYRALTTKTYLFKR